MSLGLIVVIFLIAFAYARMQGPTAAPPEDQEAAKLLEDDQRGTRD
jgi:hypothetical protein